MAEMRKHGPILLCAGGTGGHLFPAEALAEALARRGQKVVLVTDTRIASSEWVSRFPGDIHTITAGTVTGAGVFARLRGVARLVLGLKQAMALLGEIQPSLVVGFGGYPTVPPLLAAKLRRIPTLIHEANAVMGRANRFLAPRVEAIATGFPVDMGGFAHKTVFTGNPVRRPVLLAAAEPYTRPEITKPFRLLVFGGSQGARVMSDVVPGAMQHIPDSLRRRLHIIQQAREEDLPRVEKFYTALGITHDVKPFFADLPYRIAASHLVIARAGAMTVSELAVIGRPGILVPLPGALDQDQAMNAAVLTGLNAAISLPQNAFTPVSLADILVRLADAPERLCSMAEAARKAAMPDAAEKLADHALSMPGEG